MSLSSSLSRSSPYIGAVVLLTAVAWVRGPRPVEPATAFPPPRGAPPGPRALLLFQVADCADTRTDLARWMPAGTAEGAPAGAALPVEGVLVGPLPRDREQIGRLLTQAGIRSPVRRDTEGEGEALLHALGYRRTPVLVVLDAEGRLVLVRPLSAVTPEVLSPSGPILRVVGEVAS